MLICWKVNKLLKDKDQEISALNNTITAKSNEIAKIKDETSRKIKDRDIEIQRLK